MLLLYNSF